MPVLLQASMSSVPAGTVSFLPSTVRVTSDIENRSSLFAFRSGLIALSFELLTVELSCHPERASADFALASRRTPIAAGDFFVRVPYLRDSVCLPAREAGLKARTTNIRYTSAGSALFSNGHGLPSRWSSNSFRYFCMYEMIGMAAASPSGQNVRPSMFSARYFKLSISFATPPPACMRVSVFFIQSVPSRQGMHQPQLSCW